MENQAEKGSRAVPSCSNCGEAQRVIVGSFGLTSPFSVATGHALGVIPVAHPSYLEGVACLACGAVQLRLADRDLQQLRAKLEQ